MRKIALRFNVPRTPLAARMGGRRTMEELNKSKQVLTPGEEQSLVEVIEKLHSWGWPCRVSQVRHLATNILRSRNSNAPKLGDGWISRFLSCHPELKSRFSTPKDKDRVASEDLGVFMKWFDLFFKF